MIVEHIQPVGHMVIKSLRRYRKVSQCSRIGRKRSTDHLPDACMEHSFSDRCGAKGGEGPGSKEGVHSNLLVLPHLYPCWSFQPFFYLIHSCGRCDGKRRHFTEKKGDKCSYFGECGQDANSQDTTQGTDKKHLMKAQIELKPSWIKMNHHGYSPFKKKKKKSNFSKDDLMIYVHKGRNVPNFKDFLHFADILSAAV